MRFIAALFIATAVLSGCTANGPAPPVAPDATADFVAGQLHMEECSGISFGQVYPRGMNPAPVPEHWGVAEDDTDTLISVWLWECPRVGLDHLERPATVLWEVSDNARPPAGCGFGEGWRPRHIVSVLTDDAVLSDHLVNEYGLPARLASFERTPSATGQTWSWEASGETSRLETVWVSDMYRGEASGSIDRWVWPTEDGVGWMDVNRTRTQNAFLRSVTEAEVGPSHYVGVGGRFAGISYLMHDAEWFARITTGGPECD